MPFLSDVLAVVIVMVVYFPFQLSLCVCEPWVRKCGFQNIFCRDVNERPRYHVSQCEMLDAFSLQNSVVSKFNGDTGRYPMGQKICFLTISSGQWVWARNYIKAKRFNKDLTRFTFIIHILLKKNHQPMIN